MNASSWKKAADLVAQGIPANPQVQAAATAESKQFESLPLSALSADDSGPPQVTYGSQQPSPQVHQMQLQHQQQNRRLLRHTAR